MWGEYLLSPKSPQVETTLIIQGRNQPSKNKNNKTSCLYPRVPGSAETAGSDSGPSYLWRWNIKEQAETNMRLCIWMKPLEDRDISERKAQRDDRGRGRISPDRQEDVKTAGAACSRVWSLTVKLHEKWNVAKRQHLCCWVAEQQESWGWDHKNQQLQNLPASFSNQQIEVIKKSKTNPKKNKQQLINQDL